LHETVLKLETFKKLKKAPFFFPATKPNRIPGISVLGVMGA
jgi:hypothetical protein